MASPCTPTGLDPRPLRADLRQVIYALSDALDLVGVDDIGHGKRVGVMAAACARARHAEPDDVAFLFDLGLLHDIGVSSTAVHGHLVGEFAWEGAMDHCRIGHDVLAGFPPLARMAPAVLHHHTRWDRLVAADVDPATALAANLVHLVDRVDALAVPHHADGTLLASTRAIRDRVASHAGTRNSPELVGAFLEASRAEAFWLELEPRGLQACLGDMLARGGRYEANASDLRQLAAVFSGIVDAKSPFTAAHSLGVARLARFLAERLGVGPDHCDKIEIAGLLHDLGKLRVPDEILDKPAKLDPRERLVMNTHSFETFQILRHVPGFEEVATWAAWHHEEPGGNGYPFHLAGGELPLEARILRVADIFQAMAQHRPYRAGLPANEVLAFVEDMARQGSVDAGIVAVAAADVPGAMAAALGGPAA